MKPRVIEGDVPLDMEIRNNESIMIISKDQSFLTHGIHKFPAKFFPELPRYLIRKYSNKDDLVLDPMCGSGTTILEAILEGRNAIGTDIDPIAEIVSKTKTTPINPTTLDKCRRIIFKEILKKVATGYKPQIPEFNYRDCWFEPFVLRELAIIKESVDSIKANGYSKKEADNLHRFFNVVFSSIVRDVSNADPHCTRTVIRKKLKKNIDEWDTTLHFLSSAEKQIDHMGEFYNRCKALSTKPEVKIKRIDARNTELPVESVSLAVTSPPYVNAVDYPRTHQLELYWLGLINGTPLSEMKRNYIGTETVYRREYDEMQQSGYPKLDKLVSDIYQIDPRRAFIVFKFFKDMEANLKEVYRVLKKEGRYCIVIGNNTIRGHEVLSQEIMTEIATSNNIGFELEKRFHSGLINHFIKIPRKERMQGEWVLVLRKLIKPSQARLSNYHSS